MNFHFNERNTFVNVNPLPGVVLLLNPFNGLFSRTTWVSWHQKSKPFWILLEQEMMGGGNGISWTICKSFARPYLGL